MGHLEPDRAFETRRIRALNAGLPGLFPRML
jgi:hypothetical protein